MRVIPSIIIDNDSSVAHTSDLITVVPPREDLAVLWGVLLHPIVCFSEVIDYHLVAFVVRAG
jgi:hypothetical protein